MRRTLTVPVGLAAAVYVAAMLCLAFASSPAYAGQWVQVSCENPSGSSAPSQGWTSFVTGSPGYGSNNGTSCNAASPMYAILSSAAAEAVNTGENLQYTPPAGSSLAGGEVQVYMEAYGGGLNASGTAVLYSPNFEYSGSSVFFQCAAGLTACSPSGAAFSGVLALPSDRGGDLYIGAGCGGTAGYTCDSGGSNGAWSFIYVYRADLLLSNDATPAASGFGGSLLSGSARGGQELSFTATDASGPGVYTVSVVSEGQTLYSGTPDTNSGQCASVGEWNGVAMFDYAQPCRISESVDLPIQTTSLPDGSHPLKVTVEDAAGNSAVVYDAAISTDNAPADSSAPSVLADSQVTVGAPLSTQPGTWSAPEGAGTISDAYQWEACNSEGEACKAIPGAQGDTYTPAPSDVGHTLRLTLTAADNDGSSSASSPATSVVQSNGSSLGAEPGPGAGEGQAPISSGSTNNGSTGGSVSPSSAGSQSGGGSPSASSTGAPSASVPAPATTKAVIHLGVKPRITRSFAHRALHSVTGRLMDGHGHPIAYAKLTLMQRVQGRSALRTIGHVKTGAKGAFRAHLPPAPSRLIEIAYRASSKEAGHAATAKINESVQAGVKLRITPRSTSPTGTILLTGRVLGPIPKEGVQIHLLVHYHGRWEPFRTPRTDGSGHFSVAYQFQDAYGRYPFTAEVPKGQAGFSFTSGKSEVLDVTTH